MATLDYTGDSVAGSGVPNEFIAKAIPVTLYRRLKVADIIAADTTMTTNGYITADDIIQALHVNEGFVFDKAVIRIITACTADVNVEVGLNGGAEAIASFDADGAAGACGVTIETDSFAGGKVFTANDTIDVQFITANCLVGELELFVFGKQLVLGTA